MISARGLKGLPPLSVGLTTTIQFQGTAAAHCSLFTTLCRDSVDLRRSGRAGLRQRIRFEQSGSAASNPAFRQPQRLQLCARSERGLITMATSGDQENSLVKMSEGAVVDSIAESVRGVSATFL